MKKVININFQGRVVPIEENAYDILKQYVDSLRRHFAEEEGKDEIINDIESRIAELFAEVLKKGSTCITDEDVENIIRSMGRPEDFDDEEGRVHAQLSGEKEKAKSSSSQQSYNYANRRLYRDENNKVLGGVCGGVANYFGIDPLIVRILAVVSLGISFFPYLVLWIAIPSSATQVIGSTRKRLFRDMDDKIIGGVCSGIGHYFGIKAWIPRVLFLIPFLSFVTNLHHWMVGFPDFLSLSFSPGATILYIVLWMLLPEAVTSADKLEMKGERVDLNSIKNTIQTDMEGFRGRAEKFGADIKDRAKDLEKELSPRAQQFANEVAYAARKNSRGLGGAIILLVKIFAYFILGSVSLITVVTLFALGVAFIGISPKLDFLMANNGETTLAWATVITLVWLPIIGIITWFVRRITNTRKNSGIYRTAFIALTVIGFVCLMFLLASLKSDFRYESTGNEQKLALSNAKVDKLELQLTGYDRKERGSHWFRIRPFENIDGDTVFVPNVIVDLQKAASDSFEVSVERISNGKSKAQANELADKIKYNLSQKDSLLSFYKGIPINTTDKFRNQTVKITIGVPVGKRIKVDNHIGWRTHLEFSNFSITNSELDWNDDYFDDKQLKWIPNKEYVMTENGKLQLVGGNNEVKEENGNDGNDESIEEKKQSLEDLKEEIDEKKREMDEKQRELKQELEDEQRKLDEKKRELKMNGDTAAPKSKYQKTVAAPKGKKPDAGAEDLPSLSNTI